MPHIAKRVSMRVSGTACLSCCAIQAWQPAPGAMLCEIIHAAIVLTPSHRNIGIEGRSHEKIKEEPYEIHAEWKRFTAESLWMSLIYSGTFSTRSFNEAGNSGPLRP